MYLDMNAGDDTQAWVVVEVAKDDPSPYLRLMKDNFYFALYEFE